MVASTTDSASFVPSYKNLPPLAGVATMADAMKPGLQIDECVTRLKCVHYALKRLHQILTARITAEPIYELKMAFSLHAWLCAEHVAAYRDRVAEMREPPLGLDAVPDPALEVLFDEIVAAPTTEELIGGVYAVALPSVRDALQRHIKDTNPLVDHPSVRVARFAMLEVDDMIAYGQKAIASLVDKSQKQEMSPWIILLQSTLEAAGGIDGALPKSGKPLARQHSVKPYVYDGRVKRDERFIDPYNRGVNAESFLYNEQMPANAKTLMMYYKRLREIDVPEMMASIITETPGKPWGYYREMSRQLWDEARHAMMGEVGFNSVGVDWRTIPICFTWSLNLNTLLKPIERHAVLYFIERGLMSKTGKRYEFEVAQQSGSKLSALIQDYDWADEVLHASIGRTWYVKTFADSKEAIKYGDECWSRVLSDFEETREKGLTQHTNWWPDVYRAACKRWGIEPDPAALAFEEDYSQTRADLKEVSASG